MTAGIGEPRSLDSDWLRSNPLPVPADDTDKNGRGRLLAVGGCRTVPGGIRLTVEAALRAGAGKVQVATIASAASALGVAMPEVAVFGMPETTKGDIAPRSLAEIRELIERSDAVIVGPAMADPKSGAKLVGELVKIHDTCLVIDAGALIQLGQHAAALRRRANPAVLTPHMGEMAAMLNRPMATIEADRIAAVREAAENFGAVCLLKGATTLIASPQGDLYVYAGGGVGLATGGSGDVMAGIVAGLCARGTAPLNAALWAVWLHGEAGRRCAEQLGPIGFLARELIAHVPALMRAL